MEIHISIKHVIFVYYSFSVKDRPEVILETAQMPLHLLERDFQHRVSKSDGSLVELFLPSCLSIENQI